jgi:hypothetical protein
MTQARGASEGLWVDSADSAASAYRAGRARTGAAIPAPVGWPRSDAILAAGDVGRWRSPSVALFSGSFLMAEAMRRAGLDPWPR